jgi:hypothetical protein
MTLPSAIKAGLFESKINVAPGLSSILDIEPKSGSCTVGRSFAQGSISVPVSDSIYRQLCLALVDI